MTVQIELDGVVMLTDPWFGPIGFIELLLAPRIIPPIATSINELGHIDALLISHNHIDHCDDLSLEVARDNNIKIIGPHSVIKRAKRLGATLVDELAPGEVYRLDGILIKALHANHPFAKDALMYMIYGNKKVFFSGDTRYTSDLYEALKSSPPDIALVQAACAHYFVIGNDGMSLSEVTNLGNDIKPSWIFLIHLHCAGKWLDRNHGIRIKKNNQMEVIKTLEHWKIEMENAGLNVLIPSLGEEWQLKE